jgi:fluoroacetyl-CoA thioesterase
MKSQRQFVRGSEPSKPMETHPAAAIELGASARRQVVVTAELTVKHAYPTLPAVYATPQMIYLMELAAADAIAALLPQGWGSVGTLVDVRHLAATPIGCTVSAKAEVIEVNDRIVRFAVRAEDGTESIGEGFHERALIDLARFIDKVERKTASDRAAGVRP